jgi:hypothetical protein
MFSHITRIMVVLAVLCGVAMAAPEKAVSRVTSVTLYRDSATVTRTVNLPAKSGDLQIIVSPLPSNLLPETLAALGADGVTVRSVQYRQQPIYNKPNPKDPTKSQKIQQELADLAENQYELASAQKVIVKKGAYLDQVEKLIVTPSKQKDQPPVKVAEVLEATKSIFDQRTQLATAKYTLDKSLRELQKKQRELGRELGVYQNQRQQRVVRRENQAILHVRKSTDKATTVELQYTVAGTRWLPSYEVRLDDKTNTVKLDYTASVYQQSGESWDNVKLTLSTAQPSLNCEIPFLQPMVITPAVLLHRPTIARKPGKKSRGRNPQEAPAPQAEISRVYQQKNSRAKSWNRNRGQRGLSGNANPADKKDSFYGSNFRANVLLNSDADVSQVMELQFKAKDIQRAMKEAQQTFAGIAVTYTLEGTTTLTSQSLVQKLPIAALTLQADVYRQATPVLSPYVYIGTTVNNASSTLLLPGPYRAFVGTEFVGQGQIPRTAVGQELKLGFGVDSQMLCQRELIKKSENVTYGTRTVTFDYALKVDNFSKVERKVRLFGRMPTTEAKDVEITITQASQKVSDEKHYVTEEEPKGILRFDVAVKPGQQGLKANTVTYTYEIKTSKDVNLKG